MKARCVNCKRLTGRVVNRMDGEAVACCDSCVISLGERLLTDLVRDGFFDEAPAAVLRPALSRRERIGVWLRVTLGFA